MAVEIGSAILKVDRANTAPQNGAHSVNNVPLMENSPQSLTEHWQSRSTESDTSTQNSFLDSTGEDSGDSMNSEPSSSGSEVDSLREERRKQASSSKVNVSSSPSAVVLKKPITVSRPMFEKDVGGMTDLPGTLRDNNEDSRAGVTSKDSGSLDLTTGLKALRRLIFRKNFDLAKDLAKEVTF